MSATARQGCLRSAYIHLIATPACRVSEYVTGTTPGLLNNTLDRGRHAFAHCWVVTVGCGTSLSGVVLPLKGAADADYPAPAAIPAVDVSGAALDKVRSDRAQFLCEVKGGQARA